VITVVLFIMVLLIAEANEIVVPSNVWFITWILFALGVINLYLEVRTKSKQRQMAATLTEALSAKKASK